MADVSITRSKQINSQLHVKLLPSSFIPKSVQRTSGTPRHEICGRLQQGRETGNGERGEREEEGGPCYHAFVFFIASPNLHQKQAVWETMVLGGPESSSFRNQGPLNLV